MPMATQSTPPPGSRKRLMSIPSCEEHAPVAQTEARRTMRAGCHQCHGRGPRPAVHELDVRCAPRASTPRAHCGEASKSDPGGIHTVAPAQRRLVEHARMSGQEGSFRHDVLEGARGGAEGARVGCYRPAQNKDTCKSFRSFHRTQRCEDVRRGLVSHFCQAPAVTLSDFAAQRPTRRIWLADSTTQDNTQRDMEVARTNQHVKVVERFLNCECKPTVVARTIAWPRGEGARQC